MKKKMRNPCLRQTVRGAVVVRESDHVSIYYEWPDGTNYVEQHATREFDKVPNLNDRILCEITLSIC